MFQKELKAFCKANIVYILTFVIVPQILRYFTGYEVIPLTNGLDCLIGAPIILATIKDRL